MFKSQRQIIQEIHNEFDTAEDRLLCEAQKIISSNSEKVVYDKAKRLKDAGFVNTELVLMASAKQQALVNGKEQADLIMYYKQKYPFQKFITQQELDRICNKYGLVYAPVANYTKEVPDKNLFDIENAEEVDVLDRVENEYWIEITKSYYERKIPSNQPKKFILPKEIKRSYLSTNHSASRWSILNTHLSGFSDSSTWFVENHTCTEIKKEGLFIAAPMSHFKMDGLKKKGRFGFLNISITEVKDPIVFRYVRGGIQIITKWGLEASDPSLLNDIDN